MAILSNFSNARVAQALSEKWKRGFKERQDFFGEWLGNPIQLGAIAPSGKVLAERMAALVPMDEAGLVLELGPGTGVFTRALLDRGIDPSDLALIEFNRNFVRKLRFDFPSVTIAAGDAAEIEECLLPYLGTVTKRVRTVVSGLPLQCMSVEKRLAIMASVARALRPGGSMIQFTYHARFALSNEQLAPLGLRVESAGVVLRNFPPATLWRISNR